MDLEPGYSISVSGTAEAIDGFWRECLRHQEQPTITRCTMHVTDGGEVLEAVQDKTGRWHLFSGGAVWSA